MFSALFNFFKHLLIPYGIFFLAIYGAAAFTDLPQRIWPYAGIYPLIVFGLAAVLCWRFHKDRYMFAVVAMAASERALFYLAGGAGNGPVSAHPLIYEGIGILLPINILVFELVKDRGVVSFWGILRWAWLALQVGLFTLLYVRPDGFLAEAVKTCSDPVGDYLSPVFPDGITATFVLAALILLIRIPFRQILFETSSVWVLALLYLGIYRPQIDAGTTCYFAFAALIYIGAIVDTSYHLAFHDELTGLPARRALNDRLMQLGAKYAIAMVDIDHFKKFNDRYGHDVGDQVLKMVAAKLKAVSGGGRVYRYGGEEFAIIFPGGSLDQARGCLESLRKSIAEKKFTIRAFGRAFNKKNAGKPNKRPRQTVKITVSMGVSEKSSRHPSPEDVIKAADKALYRAKKAGRNRVST